MQSRLFHLATVGILTLGSACTGSRQRNGYPGDAATGDAADGVANDYLNLDDCITVTPRGRYPVFHPSLTFTGSEFGLAWQTASDDAEDLQVLFRRLQHDGTPREPVTLVNEVQPGNPHSAELNAVNAVWNTRGWGVLWLDRRNLAAVEFHDVYFANLDAVGRKIGTDNLVTAQPDPRFGACGGGVFGCLRPAWNGSAYGLAWDGGLFGEYGFFASFADVGERVRNTELPAWHYANEHTLWTGSEFAVLFQQFAGEGETPWYLVRVSSDGNSTSPIIPLDPQPVESSIAEVVWTGSEIGTLWITGYMPLRFRMTFTTPRGALARPAIDLPGSAQEVYFPPHLLWTGSEYTTIWNDRTESTFFTTFHVVSITDQGELLPEELLTSNLNGVGDFSAVWTGSDYAIVFNGCFDRFALSH